MMLDRNRTPLRAVKQKMDHGICRPARTLPLALTISLLASSFAPSLAQGNSDSQGRPEVSAQVMASHCITMVSPHSPQLSASKQGQAVVVLQVAISRLGGVAPLRVLSGPPSLQAEAMDAVRLWRYRPYMRDGVAIDVTTQVPVTFTPGKAAGLVTHPAG
jgi:TonB family protein